MTIRSSAPQNKGRPKFFLSSGPGPKTAPLLTPFSTFADQGQRGGFDPLMKRFIARISAFGKIRVIFRYTPRFGRRPLDGSSAGALGSRGLGLWPRRGQKGRIGPSAMASRN